MGIQVSALTLDLHSKHYNPNNMVDFYGIVEDNLKPVRRS
jgi:hypothetical protein